jgi:hypothetical protein
LLDRAICENDGSIREGEVVPPDCHSSRARALAKISRDIGTVAAQPHFPPDEFVMSGIDAQLIGPKRLYRCSTEVSDGGHERFVLRTLRLRELCCVRDDLAFERCELAPRDVDRRTQSGGRTADCYDLDAARFE